MTPALRAGRPDDADAVLALWAEADAEPTSTDSVAALLDLLDHDPGALILAEVDGRVVGSVIAAWDGWRGSVYRLAVAPDHRRRGVAGRLVAAAEDRLAALGARRLQAVVVADDDRATGFWQAGPWERQAARLRYVRTLGDGTRS